MKKDFLTLKKAARFLLGISVFTSVFAVSCVDRDDYPTFDPPAVEQEEVLPPDADMTATTKLIMEKSTLIGKFQLDSTKQLADGIVHTHIRFLNRLEQPVSMHVLEVDLTKSTVAARAISPYNHLLYTLQSLTEMARDNHTAESKIVAAINGDSFTASTGEPTGSYYKDGVARKVNTSVLIPYFAVLKDGKVVIGNKPKADDVAAVVDVAQVQQLISGKEWLLFDHKAVSLVSTTVEARTILGLTPAGKLFVLVVDGAQAKFSVGATLADMQSTIQALGAKTAFSLDGGTSASLVKYFPESQKWQLLNNPTIKGGRTLANGIGFTAK